MFTEIHRVLRPGCCALIYDARKRPPAEADRKFAGYALGTDAFVQRGDGYCIIHDSKRLQRRWPWLCVKTISLTIPRDFRVHWWNSIKSSYTADELRAILQRSRLTGWRIEKDFMDLAVVIG